MEMKESGSVILTSFHFIGQPMVHLPEESFVSSVSTGHSRFSRLMAKVSHGLTSSEQQKGSSGVHRRLHCPGPRAMSSQDALHSASVRCRSSQDHPGFMEHSLMEDYWSEKRNIEEAGHSGYERQFVERHSMDEAELEEAWLKEAGLSTLVSGAPGDSEPTEALLSTLTRSQAAMVRKRVDNYTQTMRKRNKQPMRHVRDVFSITAPMGSMGSKDPTPVLNGDVAEGPPPKPQAPPCLPCWIPVRGGEGGLPDVSQKREIFFSEMPYSEEAGTHKKEKECRDCRRFRVSNGELPTFRHHRPRLGLTGVHDLSAEDMKKVSCFALIELTTFYDCLGIELKRCRTVLRHKSGRESGIFGVPLAILLENDQKFQPESRVPLVFKKLVSKLEQTGLQTEGILRVPGSVSRLKHLRQELETKFYEGRFDWEQVRHNDAAGLLKSFIRELPNPLLTLQHLPTFTAVLNISSLKHQVQALHLLIMLLPEPHRDTLKALLEFLSKVVAHEDKNRMSLWNVSMVVAPNLFVSRGKVGKMEEVQRAAGEAQLVRLLITHQDLLWTVPCFLISHIRKMNEASMGKKFTCTERSKRRLLRRRQAGPDKDRNERTDLQDGVIRVQAPQHEKISMAIQLYSDTKVKDIVARFTSTNSRGSRNTRRHRQYLFEVGGNIGERCLDPEMYILDLYHVNPTCEWILKPRVM